MESRRNTIASQFVFVAGLMLGMAALVQGTYALWRVVVDMNQGQLPGDFIRSIAAVWVFSSMGMLLLAVWSFFISSQLAMGFRQAFFQGIALGVSLLFFGLGAFLLLYPQGWQYFLFLVDGSLILCGVLFFFRTTPA